MEPSREDRRSSILKTRNEGGSGDIGGIVEGKDTTLSSGNLKGVISRRVNFSQTNHVKEFEKTYLSTESLSKTHDPNQTMCDMSMDDSHWDYHAYFEESQQDPNQTRCNHTIDVHSNEDEEVTQGENFPPIDGSKLSTTINDPNKAKCDLGMSIVDDKTKIVDQTRRGINMASSDEAEDKQSEVAKMYFGKPDPPFLGKLKTLKRAVQQQKEVPYEKLSFGKFGSAKTPKRIKIQHSVPQQQPQNPVVMMAPVEVPKANPALNDAIAQTSPMPVAPLPIRATTQEIGLNCTIEGMDLDFKKIFDASLMTSRIVFHQPPAPRTLLRQSSPIMESVSVGTEISFQSDHAAIIDSTNKPRMLDAADDCAVTSNSSHYNSIYIGNVSESLVWEQEEDEQEEGVNEILNHDERGDMIKQAETLSSVTTFYNSHFSLVFDDDSYVQESDKPQDSIFEESLFFESTLPLPPTIQTSTRRLTSSSNVAPGDHLPSSVPQTPMSALSADCIELIEKLNDYVNTHDLDVFVKWGFLGGALDKLSRLPESEWQEILSCEKIALFLGDDFIKAININRERLNDTNPFYLRAMKYGADMKKRGMMAFL